MTPAPPGGGRTSRSAAALALGAIVAAALVAGLVGLGVWQLQRRAWKLRLIAQVEARVQARPIDAPGPDAWPHLSADADAYRRVIVRGRFLNDRESHVQAVTERGAGFWVMTPMATDRGFTVLIDRGFVPAERVDPRTRTAGQVEGDTTVVGLLRMSEPHGGFLRANAPGQDRWYSRDVAAIGAARRLRTTAPYFIDADATPNPGGLPVGGLTVIRFANSHLVYALTWFGLALLLCGGCVPVAREALRRRRALEP